VVFLDTLIVGSKRAAAVIRDTQSHWRNVRGAERTFHRLRASNSPNRPRAIQADRSPGDPPQTTLQQFASNSFWLLWSALSPVVGAAAPIPIPFEKLSRAGKRAKLQAWVLISDELFDAYLKCKTKAYLTFGHARWVSPRTRSVTGNGTSLRIIRRTVVIVSDLRIAGLPRWQPGSEDLKNAKYRLIIQPYMTAQDVGSNIHALERDLHRLRSATALRPNQFVPLRRSQRITSSCCI